MSKLDERLTGRHDNCYGCVEFFHTCETWPEGKEFACLDFRPLPAVGIDGATGQKVPPSKMGGRMTPRARVAEIPPEKPKPERRPRHPGPRPYRDDAGVLRCECGQEIPDSWRCCDACREARRKEAMQRRRKQSETAPPVAQEGP